MTRYTIGQTVTVEIATPSGSERVTGTVTNTLPADVIEHCVLVVVTGLHEDTDGTLVVREGTQYVSWFAPWELDQWQTKAA